MPYLEADVEDDIYIELPEAYSKTRSKIGLLKKAIHGLVHADLLWLKIFVTELEAE